MVQLEACIRIVSGRNLIPGTVQKFVVAILTTGSHVQLSMANLFNIIISRVEKGLRISSFCVCVCLYLLNGVRALLSFVEISVPVGPNRCESAPA